MSRNCNEIRKIYSLGSLDLEGCSSLKLFSVARWSLNPLFPLLKEFGPADVGVSLKKTKNGQLITTGYFRVPRASYKNEVECSAFDMVMIFHSHVNKVTFTMKGCALDLILKVRVFGTRKWPIFHRHSIVLCNKGYPRHSWILDSTLWIPDCSTVKIGFRIPIASGILDSLSWTTDSKAQESEFHKQTFPGSQIFHKHRFLSLWNVDYLEWDKLKEIKFNINWWINSLIINESNSMLQRRRRRQRQRGREKSKTTTLHVHHAFWTFLRRRCCRTTTWKCLISCSVEDVNTRKQLSFSFPELWCSLVELNYEKICQNLTN